MTKILHSPDERMTRYAARDRSLECIFAIDALHSGALMSRTVNFVLAAVVVAGFFGQALGLWAAILWGCGLLLGIALYFNRRRAHD